MLPEKLGLPEEEVLALTLLESPLEPEGEEE